MEEQEKLDKKFESYEDSVNETVEDSDFEETDAGRDEILSVTDMEDGVEIEVLSVYTMDEAVEDGILFENPMTLAFPECRYITIGITDLDEEDLERIMKEASRIYNSQEFEGDYDRDFFAIRIPELPKVWCVRNEKDTLTMMLPEEY